MRKAMVGIVLVGLVACAGVARGQPADRADAPPRTVLGAYLVTVASTALPMAVAAIGMESTGEGGRYEPLFGSLGIAALVLGPSGGQWYAGAGFTPGLGLRLGGAALVAALVVRDPHFDQPTGTVIGLITATVAFEAGMVWDLLTLPRQVRRHNRERRMHVTPLITNRGPSAGLAIGGAF
jgi:hypothetical protein